MPTHSILIEFSPAAIAATRMGDVHDLGNLLMDKLVDLEKVDPRLSDCAVSTDASVGPTLTVEVDVDAETEDEAHNIARFACATALAHVIFSGMSQGSSQPTA